MALVLKDRVKETTTTTGTGAITLAGAVTNFQTFTSVLSNADTTYYAIIDDTNGAFEVGLGTFASSGTTLTRTTILESSNSGSAVNLGTGTKQVFMTYPAEKSVFLNASNQIELTGGAISIKNTGSESRIDFYCEDNNQHYVRLQAPPHGNFSGNPTVVLPSTAGTIALTSDITSQDLDATTDSGTIDVLLGSETLTVAGGSGISTSATGTTITVAGDDASTSSKGVASFSSDDFSVSSGAVTIKSGGVTNTQLAGSIANSKLSNSSVSFGGVSLALGASDATPAFDLTDATNYPTSSLSGTITNAQLAGSIANSKLSNSSVSFGGVSLALGASDATPAFDLSDATNYPTSSLSGTITNAQLAGSIANSKLANSSITVSDGSNTTATALGGTITFSGTSNEVDVAESSGTITIGLPNDVTIGQNLTVTGDLTVNGTTTTVNSTTVTVDDPIFTLGGDSAPGSDDNKDRGIEFRYHDGSSARVGFFGYDDSNTAFTLFTEATNSSEVFSGTVGNAIFNQITGTLQTAAQSNITSLGTLTTLTVDDVTINGKSISILGSATDLVSMQAGTNGTLAITTNDTDGANANITITADGIFEAIGTTITLDSGGDVNLETNALRVGNGEDTDITFSFNANTNDGLITWMEDEDYFQFSDDVLLNANEKLYFRDTAIYINSSTDGQLDLVADTEIQVAATTVDINGNVDISGTTTQTGVSTSAAKDVFNAGMSVKNGSSGPGFIEFFEDSDHGGNFVKLQANANDQSYAADQTLTLPSTTGTIATTDDATALAIALG
mgnify:CR=1 FL=1